MLEKLTGKFCTFVDNSPSCQRFFVEADDKKMRRQALFVLVLALALTFFWFQEARAGQPDFTNFFAVHRVNPVLVTAADAAGQPVSTVDQVDLLVQLPGEDFARRIRVNLQNTLFLDPRAPIPGEKTYKGILETDGSYKSLE